MSYNRGYQGGSPWASGAPPQMYGGPPLPPAQPQHSYGGGAPAYGTPQVAPPNYGYGRQMGPNHPINPPVPPVWGQGPIGGGGGGPMQMSHQRGGNMRPIGGPTGKRSGGHWNDNAPNKRFNRNRGQGNLQGGNNNNNNNNNNRKDGRKFENRHNFPRDNRNKQNKQQGKGNENDNLEIKRQQPKSQPEQPQKESETLEKKEYQISNTTLSADEEAAKKAGEVEAAQSRYVAAVTGFCCKLCDVFIRDKAASVEHCTGEAHVEKFNKAEEERLSKEKEEQEKKNEKQPQPSGDEKKSPIKTANANGDAAPEESKVENGTDEEAKVEECKDDAEEK